MLFDIKKTIQNYQPKPLGQQKEYAVVLPLVNVDDEIHLLYEVRSKNITQPGETSFPGGKIENNETPKEACLRETFEELSIPTETIEIYGEIDYIVNENQIIHCFIGFIHDFDLKNVKVNTEVERIFTVPISYFIENEPEFYNVSAKYQFQSDFPINLINNGKEYKFHDLIREIPFYDIPDGSLWGYTAAFTRRFIELIK